MSSTIQVIVHCRGPLQWPLQPSFTLAYPPCCIYYVSEHRQTQVHCSLLKTSSTFPVAIHVSLLHHLSHHPLQVHFHHTIRCASRLLGSCCLYYCSPFLLGRFSFSFQLIFYSAPLDSEGVVISSEKSSWTFLTRSSLHLPASCNL